MGPQGGYRDVVCPAPPKGEFSSEKASGGSLLASGQGINNNGAFSGRTIWLTRSVLGSATIPPGGVFRARKHVFGPAVV